MRWQYKLIGFVWSFNFISLETDFAVIVFLKVGQKGHVATISILKVWMLDLSILSFLQRRVLQIQRWFDDFFFQILRIFMKFVFCFDFPIFGAFLNCKSAAGNFGRIGRLRGSTYVLGQIFDLSRTRNAWKIIVYTF